MNSFYMPAETTSERRHGSVITRYGNGRYGGEYRPVQRNRNWVANWIPYYRNLDRPDFNFDPCEYCEVEPADGRASNGARVCIPCYEDHHGTI